MPSTNDGGLGSHLVGDRVQMGQKTLHVTKLLGEGGFSYVYLAKEVQEGTGLSSSFHQISKGEKKEADDAPVRRSSGTGASTSKHPLVLKITSIHSRAQRDIAEKEAKLLSRLSHPSIIKMYDTCYRNVAHNGTSKKGGPGGAKERPQHLILMEFCEGGHALDVCNKLASSGQRFDLSTLIIAFGQICNAVSYLHAQRPPIVHRDLKPVNFLVKNGAYKLCDFGSAVFGHIDLRTSKARADAEEVIQKTTTQMFRAPEMVDLYMAKKLTQATDVWALGSCLYQLAFLQNCFEEGSNLAILSRKYTIPEDNPYGEGLVELLDRMLTVDSKQRADMTEVILCLSAVYSGRELPPRKKQSKVKQDTTDDPKNPDDKKKEDKSQRIGTFRTDGQGYQETLYDPTKATEGKKLASNSVAARRKRAAGAGAGPTSLPPTTPSTAPSAAATAEDPLAFSSFQGSTGGEEVAFGADFGEMKGFDTKGDDTAFFGSFDDAAAKKPESSKAFDAAFDAGAWGENNPSSAEPAASQDQGQEAETVPAPAPPPADAAASAAAQEEAEPSGDDKKSESPTDSQRKERSRRRRGGDGRTRSSKPTTGVEAGVEAMNVAEGGSAPAEGEKKDRRSGRSTRAEEEKERKRSGSRPRRKARPPRVESGTPRPATEDPAAASSAPKGPKRGSSFRAMFNR
eukprot:CAMPEP_0117069128 /NCGR_PEP_ID=MMETSP0472-20121206/48455_1 /TAXON_ID=693140 ORGANISM="Tiarina fusus, Strain LIS" /NCGR_SAMPLE_ID=MMETSP0472 /ASSEMBLY_ACC=CAM_ASM_000603 /LENGTH=681 /DNA_ID=CAMNT_0004791481 /DNA_START=173 /DNA_END=2214 /DNA_ORIENTATION=-